MKKLLCTLSLAALLGSVIASPVDVNQAKNYGLKYVQHTLGHRAADLELVTTRTNGQGVPCLYVFNYDQGFLVVSADDIALPVLGYSEEGQFDPNNVPDGLDYYLGFLANQINYGVEHGMAQEPEYAEAWAKFSSGTVAKATRGVGPLINLNWNQDYPYNYYCPTHNYGPGGHVYAGCAADAMAMMMKYWNWPDHGEGTYSYKPEGFPTQSADFENTYYEWDNMPASIYSGSPIAYIQAIARLMSHCGISIDMQYNYNGSGAFSEDVPGAIANHFRYTNYAYLDYRDNYTKTQWEDLLIASLDQGIPMYYAATDASQGGHAFVCDGYNDNRYFRFNWGWSGTGNNFFAIDALNAPGYVFNYNNRAIFNFVPNYLYDAMAPAIEDLVMYCENAHSKNITLFWTNPTTSVTGQPLESIESVVVLRNGTEIYTSNNVVPGEEMSFNDEVPEYDCYTYTIYYVTNGLKGRFASFQHQFGPTCSWKVIGQTTNFQGWNGGKIQVLNSFNTVIDEVTLTSSTPVSQVLAMPQGAVSFRWVAPLNNVNNLTITIKNSSNQTVYTYTGASTGLNGVLHTDDNDCDGCLPPTNFTGEYNYEGGVFGALLRWEYDTDPQSFKVYRSEDGILYECVATVDKAERQYLDPTSDPGYYFYKVTAYRNYCESTPAWTPNEETDFVSVDVTSVCEDDQQVQVYPNPSNETLCVLAENLREVAILNVLGQTVLRVKSESNAVNVNTSLVESGIYTVQVVTADAVISRQITIIH